MQIFEDMRVKLQFVEDPLKQDAQLLAWGLRRDLLIEAVLSAGAYYAECSAFDPAGFNLIIAYARAGRRLRELFVPTREWIRDDLNNQTAIRNQALRLRLHPCNLSGPVADPSGMPTNASGKGSAADSDTQKNQMDLFDALAPRVAPKAIPQTVRGYTTLVLGMNFEGEFAKAEVSVPVSFMDEQYLAFTPRVPLLDGRTPPGESKRSRPDNDAFDEIDIPIRIAQ